jgi:hypothetical protein
MPLIWKLDAANSLVVAVASGDVTRSEMERYLDAIVENEALAYRKVFDVHKGDTSMTADDVLPLAVRMRSLHDLGEMGPLAVILPPGRGKRLHRALGMIATAKRPMRVFENPMLAYRWIAKQDLPGASNEHAEAEEKDSLDWSARARDLAARVRHLARTAGAEANQMRLIAHRDTPDEKAAGPSENDEELLYRGRAEITHRGAALNICVKRVGRSWEFLCCRADRKKLGTLLTLNPEEIAASLAQGKDPLETTLDHLKGLVHAGLVVIPDVPNGAH